MSILLDCAVQSLAVILYVSKYVYRLYVNFDHPCCVSLVEYGAHI